MPTLVRLLVSVVVAGLVNVRGVVPASPEVDGFTESVILDTLLEPTGLAFLPDGRLLVTEIGGRLLLLDAYQRNAATLATFDVPLCGDHEIGLLSVAVDPDFEENGFVYLFMTVRTGLDPCDSTGRVGEVHRYHLTSGGMLDLGSKTVLLTGLRTDTGYHNGGGLVIGKDKKLYIGTGDTGTGDFGGGGPGTSTNPYAQDLTAIEGKILRIELDGSVPVDNPYVGKPPARPEVFASGFRNPFRLAADLVNGPIFVADVGEDDYEEINLLKKAGNYAWPRMEGKAPAKGKKPGGVAPALVYPHEGAASLGTAITALAVSPREFAQFGNRLFFGDLMSRKIYSVALKPGSKGLLGAPQLFASNCGLIVDMAFGPNPGGAPGVSLYYVSHADGQVRRIAPGTSGETQFVSGKALTMKTVPSPSISLQSSAAIDLGKPGDVPTAAGAALWISGDGFATMIDLPAARWKFLGKLPGGVTGFRYDDPKRESGPITNVTVTKGKQLRLTGSGNLLGFALGDTDPSPIHADLLLGTKKFCMEFGGSVKFQAGKLLSAKNAPAPSSCPND